MKAGVGTIDEQATNVVLLPATVAHYERELTQYLEAERYEEAVQLLLFLISCQGVSPAKTGEWEALLGWLQTMFPETVLTPLTRSAGEDEDDEESEEQFVRRYVANRTPDPGAYGRQLIELLCASSSPERQLMAIEQLAFAEGDELDDEIAVWLADTETHPMVQLKALQTLKKRGAKGVVQFPKLGSDVEADIEETPLDWEEFPEPIRGIIARVEEISEISQPDFPYFARQTWLEYLAYSYGTASYLEMAADTRDGAVDAWAAALHRMLLETIFGEADTEQLAELYGITEALQPLWSDAYKELKRFARIMLPATRA